MKPVVILDPHWRKVRELFTESAYAELEQQFEIVWGRDEPITEKLLQRAWPDAFAYVAATPLVDADRLASANALRAVIEVSGAFPDTIDYQACAEQNIEVLSCAPGFRNAVAEMGLAMALSLARGLVTEHELFRRGGENWLEDNTLTDFSLHGARVGFIGFGQIARELTRLLIPFNAQIKAYDPWLKQELADEYGVQLCPMDELADHSRCIFVTASPTADNAGLVTAQFMSTLADHSLLIVLSRAHLVDFNALTAEAVSGRLRIATDVFPTEPLPSTHPLRSAANALLSPHRAAAVKGGRQLIGDMILHDLHALATGSAARQLGVAEPDTINAVAGVGDASQVANMASSRKT